MSTDKQTHTRLYNIQGVPLICWQLQTKFWKLKNHICQKVSHVFKFLGIKLLYGTLKLGKIQLKVFLNWISKKNVKFQKKNSTLRPNVSTTPITAKGCRQCLLLRVVQLKGEHCQKTHRRNGVQAFPPSHYLPPPPPKYQKIPPWGWKVVGGRGRVG